MISRFNLRLLIFFCLIKGSAQGQHERLTWLNIGDSAPQLRVSCWLKGPSVENFKKNNVYVIEFWATWCKPCIAAMPHLSDLAVKYRNKIIILGVNSYENNTTPVDQIKDFVDSMGHRMDYAAAIDDSNYMVSSWIDASGDQGIPRSFVVDADGKVAWIGHPKDLDEVLPKIINNTWDINEALNKRNINKRLEDLDDSARLVLNDYVGNAFKKGDFGRPDSALLVIDKIVQAEPKLKYAPSIASHTFSFLLIKDPHKAYDYGKTLLVTPSYEEPDCYAIIDAIKWYSDKLNIPAEIYQLGAEAYQVRIKQIPYPELVDIFKLYQKMAEWYGRANNKIKAIAAEQRAIEALKNVSSYTKEDRAALEAALRQYKKM